MMIFFIFIALCTYVFADGENLQRQRPLVIGHRGTAYLPELTLATQSMAHAFGADIIEIDVCLSQDDQLIVIHDIYLDAVTNVKEVFPNRSHTDGRHYLMNFTLNELRQLKVHERINPIDGQQIYPSRFPSMAKTSFSLATLNETIELLLGLNRATNRRRELLIEIKKPEYHMARNRSISDIVLSTLKDYNLTRSTDPIIIQTFYIEDLIRMRRLGTQLRLFALITSNHVNESSTDYNYYQSESGIRDLSKIVQAVAPDYQLVVHFDNRGMILGPTNLTRWAHHYNLSIYPYTFRQDRFLGDSFPALVEYFWQTVHVDGFITDHPDVVLALLQQHASSDASTLYFSLLYLLIFLIATL